MATDKYEATKRRARELVEDGLSLSEAAERLGVNERTVRRWQKVDEAEGAGWAFAGSSADTKAREDAKTAEERRAQVERARRATQIRWQNRREGEADAAGVAASSARQRLMDTLPRIAAAVAQDQGPLAVQLSRVGRELAIMYGILTDKADKLSGADVRVTQVSEEGYSGDLAEVLSLVDRVAEARRAG
jgi:transposase